MRFFKEIKTRKFLAISLTLAYIVFNGIALVSAGAFVLPAEFNVLVTAVVSYYFGKSTALERPNNEKGDI